MIGKINGLANVASDLAVNAGLYLEETRERFIASDPASGSVAPGSGLNGIPITITNIRGFGNQRGGVITAGLKFDINVNLPGARNFFEARSSIRVIGAIRPSRWLA